MTKRDSQQEEASQIASLEAIVSSLVDAVSQLKSAFESHARDVWNTFDKMRDRDRPNYSVIFSAAALVMAFVTAMWAAGVRPLNLRDDYMEKTSEAKFDVVEKRIELIVNHFDELLHKEHEDRKSEFVLFDERLQREMKEKDDKIDIRTESNTKWIDYLIRREIERSNKRIGMDVTQ